MDSFYRAKPLSREGIANIAKKVRRIFGISDDTYYVDVIELLEKTIPKFIEEFHCEVRPDYEMQEMAITYPNENKIEIRESVYLGAVHGNGRDRFTIIHEIGHYVLHDEISTCFARRSEKIKTYENPEWQADAFAGEFLMLRTLIADMSSVKVANKCGVSPAAARYQCKKINEI
ncbi:ImmA/IrrE family metallo-endopeptidase [Aminipila sp.]|uniref:ImmA/IrrE family metallo-endopeptidase n=1 Tax=Aminipila sp. TaxID=2060095 RepID=UPI00289E5BA3|nr:ImmA/IrrE family metallo-endopeptidase [Aminipila sp.]